MQVETFECQETATEPVEASEEAIRLIETMQLTGQLSLVRPPTENAPPARCPYRKIRKDEKFVYSLLCPQQTELVRFSECPIPLRVLQLAAHAKELGLFKEYQVWSAEGEIKDPVLVAYLPRPGGQIWEKDCFILARWGEVLEAWPMLVKKAMDVWRERVRGKIAVVKAAIRKDEEAIDSLTFEQAITKESGPTYYGFL